MSKIVSNYIYGGTSDECGGPKPNEDYFAFKVLDPDTLLIVIADGMGGKPSMLQPAAIASTSAVETIERLYAMDKEVFFSNPVMMLKEAMYFSNSILGAYRISNEEQHSGFAASMTLVLIYEKHRFCFAHSGSCRTNLIRIQKDGSPRIIQLTEDHTDAMQQFHDGTLSADELVVHPGRYTLTSCLGRVKRFEMQTYNGKLRPNDILLLTTDGVHYVVRPDAMAQITLAAADWEGATKSLVNGARQEHTPDNATAVFFLNPNQA